MSFENIVGKVEIACDKQFLLFPQCFLPILRTFCHFHQIYNCRLQTLWVWKNLKFVVFQRVNTRNHLVKCQTLIEESKDINMRYKFASQTLFTWLHNFSLHIIALETLRVCIHKLFFLLQGFPWHLVSLNLEGFDPRFFLNDPQNLFFTFFNSKEGGNCDPSIESLGKILLLFPQCFQNAFTLRLVKGKPFTQRQMFALDQIQNICSWLIKCC